MSERLARAEESLDALVEEVRTAVDQTSENAKQDLEVDRSNFRGMVTDSEADFDKPIKTLLSDSKRFHDANRQVQEYVYQVIGRVLDTTNGKAVFR